MCVHGRWRVGIATREGGESSHALHCGSSERAWLLTPRASPSSFRRSCWRCATRGWNRTFSRKSARCRAAWGREGEEEKKGKGKGEGRIKRECRRGILSRWWQYVSISLRPGWVEREAGWWLGVLPTWEDAGYSLSARLLLARVPSFQTQDPPLPLHPFCTRVCVFAISLLLKESASSSKCKLFHFSAYSRPHDVFVATKAAKARTLHAHEHVLQPRHRYTSYTPLR